MINLRQQIGIDMRQWSDKQTTSGKSYRCEFGNSATHIAHFHEMPTILYCKAQSEKALTVKIKKTKQKETLLALKSNDRLL